MNLLVTTRAKVKQAQILPSISVFAPLFVARQDKMIPTSKKELYETVSERKMSFLCFSLHVFMFTSETDLHPQKRKQTNSCWKEKDLEISGKDVAERLNHAPYLSLVLIS